MAKQINTAKQKAWKRAEARVIQFADKLGKGVDKGIRETVVGLNALGINTSSSCEGHLNWGTGAPYIDIEANNKGPAKLKKNVKRNQREIQKVLLLLDKFYNNHKAPFDRRLTIQAWGWSIGRLESQGVAVLDALPKAAKAKKLKEYQKEMTSFGKFLKKQ